MILDITSLNVGGVNTRITEFHAFEGDFLTVASAFHLERVESAGLSWIYDLPGDQHLGGRHSVFYKPLKVVQNVEEFNKEWDLYYDSNKEHIHAVLSAEIKKKPGKSVDELVSLFKAADYEFARSMALFLEANPHFEPQFDMLYADFADLVTTKSTRLVEYIKKFNMVLLQEVSKEQEIPLREAFEYATYVNGSMILHDGSIPDLVEEKHLNVNDQTAYVGNEKVLFVTVHMSSKSPKCREQTTQLIESLKDEERLVFVVGDFNHDITDIADIICFSMDSDSTVSKKRSAFQVQRKKVAKIDKSKKDFIFVLNNEEGTKFAGSTSRARLINGDAFVTDVYTPNPAHPFDHAAVEATIEL